MGSPRVNREKTTSAMKVLFFVGALLAAYAVAAPDADANADADADPWYAAYGYGHLGYGYGHRYGGYRGYYRPYGYGYLGRKKRDADAVATPMLMQMQMLIHGIHMEDMVLDIMDMVTTLDMDMEDIEDITDLMDMDMDTGEGRRGMLML